MQKFLLSLFIIFPLFITYSQDINKVYSIAVLPVYNLSYSVNQNDLEDTLNSITDEIKKNSGFKVIDRDDAVKALKKKKISIDSILLDSDLTDIINKLDVDFVFYNIVAIDEKKVITIYSKTINKKNEIVTVEKSLKNIKVIKNYFKASIVEAVKKIEKDTNIKLDLPTININDLTLTNKIGIANLGAGAVFFATGLSLFIFDMAYYFDTVRDARNKYTNYGITYDEYLTIYNINIGLFVSGVSLMSLGVVLVSIGVPLFLYKSADKEISLDIKAGQTMQIALRYSFDFSQTNGGNR